ncbi:MAG: PocR ligand-binding domain-containing protein [Opitutaceae bacterium]
MADPSASTNAREETLREALLRAETTLAACEGLVFVLDAEGRFTSCQVPGDQPMFAAPNEFLGRGFREVLPPALAGPLEEKLAEVAAAGAVRTHEYTMPLAGQETWWAARIAPRYDPRGTLTGYTIFSREITEQRRAERQVQELTERLAHRVELLTEPGRHTGRIRLGDLFDLREIQRIQDAFAAATGVASIITNPDGTPITRPSNFCRLCEHIIRGTPKGRCNCYHSDAILGRQHPEGPIVQRCLSGGLWDGGTSLHAGEQHIANWLIGQVRDETIDDASLLAYAREIGADETEFRAALQEVTPMPLAQFEQICQALHLIGTQLSQLALRNVQQARFINERQLLEEQLRQAQKLEAVGQLAGGVAHDFNNILTAQFMQLALLQDRTDLPGEVHDALEVLQSGARMAADLTRQLLAFSRRQILQLQPIELNEVLAKLLKLFGRVLGEHIELQMVPAAGPVRIRGDAGTIEQVVINLVVNARDAMPRGGVLRIVCATEELAEAACTGRPDARAGRFARLTVSDSGCGMAPEILEHIFEPFFTTKAVGAGTGLGLATVYGIVKQHQGWVEVTSRIDHGTTFQVYLPLAEGPERAVGAPPERAARGGAGQLILVVEDEEPVRKLLGHLLQRLGYRVLAAADGQEALALWAQHRAEIQLLFTDMVMPGGIDGRELALRLLAESPDLRVVLASGYSLDLARQGLPEACCTFIAKPYDRARVAETVRAAMVGTG